MKIKESTYDLCLLYLDKTFGIVGLQTDDTLFFVDETFVEQEETQLRKAGFLVKEKERLTVDTLIKFNRGQIKLLTTNTVELT